MLTMIVCCDNILLTLLLSPPLMNNPLIDVQVPSGCDEMFCKNRIALWTYFYQELEKKHAREGLYCDDGRFFKFFYQQNLHSHIYLCPIRFSFHNHTINLISHFPSLSYSYPPPKRDRFMTMTGLNVSSIDFSRKHQNHHKESKIVQMRIIYHQ